jgi:dTDP-4-amino-4,6-dideoxygalactose transaminase
LIRFIRPTVPEPEVWLPNLRSSYEQRVFTNSGPAAVRFEAALADKYAGTGREVILVANCTCGIAAALLAVGASGRVVVPAFSFSATAQAVLLSGCLPVFCDVSRETWEINPGALEEVLTRYPAFGFCRDVAAIETVASRYGARLIVDGAAALGGRLESGAFVGQQGDAEAFSMHVTKVFGIGEGGVVFASRQYATRLRQACNFGLASGDIVMRGLNAKLSDFHAAIGLALLDRIDGYIERRRQVGECYDRAFASCAWASRAVNIGAPPMQMYPLQIESARRAEGMVEKSLQRGVELRRYYRPALHQASAFSSYERGHLEVSEDLASRTVCLPVYSDMADAEVATVIDTVTGAA